MHHPTKRRRAMPPARAGGRRGICGKLLATTMPLTRLDLRARITRLLRSDADLDSFAGDLFPEASGRFTDGMDRVRKTNILLDYADPEVLAKQLRLLERSPKAAAKPPEDGPIKLLYLASNPTSMDQLDLSREARRIAGRLRGGKPRRINEIEIVPRWAVRRSELQQLLLEEEPHVLHFSGHGSGRARLLFEDDGGNIAPLEAKAFVSLIGILKYRLQLVVLNACDTEPLAAALVRHVPCAVGMRQAIGDEAAATFAEAFYEALSFGKPIGAAFRLARIALEMSSIGEEQMPVLRFKRGVDVDKRKLKR
ncbi:CHAT domain-containing protein [Sorangium sp. So ce542]|uniref:CHAT domain-containing protein n=1 Tax=Sorangium sp. So ce542 TaxID=3133316 RepID=UPI003F6465FF